MTSHGLLRRRALELCCACAGVATASGVIWPRIAQANASAAGARPTGWLELTSLHTGETVAQQHRSSDRSAAEATQARFDRLLRDRRSGDVSSIDPAVLDQLVALAAAAGVEARYVVISAYRSPATNARLADQGRGVARGSLHMQGRAIDVRLRGVDCARLRDLALQAAAGGVGYYPKSDFVHVDTGRVRTWSG